MASKHRAYRTLFRLLSIAFAAMIAAPSSATASAATPPNFVLIMVDDAGLMDFQPFGGEARMPTIQAMADRGVRFTGYRSSPLCAPSRAMFLTGIDNHLNGVATIPEVIPESHEGAPGYSLTLEPGVKTVADRLRAAGYRTYMTGKWHLGSASTSELPVSHGFDRSFVLDASGADNWEQRPYSAFDRIAPWFEDDKPASLPADFYSSRFLIDQMISYLEEDSEGTERSQPFLAYIAFQAIHIPIQAPRAFTENYAGVYDEGWHVLREKRWRRAQSLGIVHSGAPLADMHAGHRRWDALSEEERRYYTRAMMVNAGMLEAMDHHIGRLVRYLESRKLLENTIFVVTSDNGPEHNDIAQTPGIGLWYALSGYNRDIETMGEENSLVSIGPEWAAAAASPGKLFKFYSSGGGIRVPLIISGPGIPQGIQRDSFAHVTDVVPTLLELAALPEQPSSGTVPITGRSLLPAIADASVSAYSDSDYVGMEVGGNAALFKGPYKLIRNTKPHGDNRWRLYDTANDPGETVDLSAQRPDLRAELEAAYENYASSVGVQAMPSGYEPIKQLTANTLRRYRERFAPLFWGVVVTVVFALALVIRRKTRH